MNDLLACTASLCIGLSLGLMGAGGSILTIPVFVYVLEKDPLLSSIYSMFVVGVCSLVGSLRAIQNHLIDLRVALVFGLPSVTGVLLARKLILPSIPSQLFCVEDFLLTKEMLFMLCLATFMFIAGIRMLQVAPHNNAHQSSKKQVETGLLLLRGLVAGTITGLMGIGGGFLIVPALYFWAHLPMKTAIGSTLFIITINSLFSFFASYTAAAIDWILLLKFSTGSIVGILIGIKLSERISGTYLKKIFGWFVLGTSCYVVYRQFSL